jgi:hypothetical protein
MSLRPIESALYSKLILGASFAGALLVSMPAEAAFDEAFFQSCAPSVASMAIDATAPRIPLSFASNIGFTVPSRVQNTGDVATCADFTWVKVPVPMSFSIFRTPFTAKIKWAGRTAANAWDCNHSLLAWAVFKSAIISGAWSYVTGGVSFGNMPDGTTECRYDNSGFPPQWGTFSLNDTAGSGGSQYRIGFFTWSHNDPNFGHSGTDCPYTQCNWPASFELTGVRPPQQNDLTTWRPSDGVWSVLDSPANNTITQQWGQSGDIPVAGDYDNDGHADFAVWRPNGATWFVINSSTGGSWWRNYGVSTDVPVPADYSGDGATDTAVRRGSNWFYLNSRTGNSHQVFIWGGSGGVPVRGNFDGDLRDDFVAYQSFGPDSTWNVSLAAGGGFQTTWGVPTDIPVSGDFDGDRKSDIAIWRPSEGNWYFADSSSGAGHTRQWGLMGDIPIPGRYDADKLTDFAVFRPTEGRFYLTSSQTGSWSSTAWGQNGDIPVQFNRGQ